MSGDHLTADDALRLAVTALDEKCSACGGRGFTGTTECDACDSLGTVPTRNGEALLAFIRRYLRLTGRLS